MRRLRLWANALHRRFPGAGLGVAGFVCLAAWVGLGREPTWLLTVLLPGLWGMAYAAAPREVWGGRSYWTIAGMWLGAGVLGAMAEWHALDPATPWLSLARYVLITGGFLVTQVSFVLARPGFVREPPEEARGVWQRLWRGVVIVGMVPAVGAIAYLVPWQVAMAARYPGLSTTRVWAVPGDEPIMQMAWSPDSRDLLVQLRDDIWLVRTEDGEATRVVEEGSMSRQPWLASGEGFVFMGKGEERRGIWFVPREGKEARQISEYGALPVCSPAGPEIAFSAEEGVLVSHADGTNERLLLEEAGVGWCGGWAPDGKHLVLVREEERAGERGGGRRTWVAGTDGESWALPFDEVAIPDDLVWLSRDMIAVGGEDRAARERADHAPLGWMRGVVAIKTFGIRGEEKRRFAIRTFMGSVIVTMAAQPEGRLLAVNPGALPSVPYDGIKADVLLLQTERGRLWRLPGVSTVLGRIAWSPDGHRLAVEGSVWDWQGSSEEHRPEVSRGVWVVSGF
jgi:hypothetical protein